MSPAESNPKIVVIDSNVLLTKRLSDALKQEGFEVVTCAQSAYALTMLEWDTPVAILCSTSLREMGAHELPAILHADIKTAHIPIIALGGGGQQALLEAFRAGCDDYVDRGLGPQNIAAHVRDFLRSRQEVLQSAPAAGSDTALTGSLSCLSLPGVIQMLCQSRQTGALHVNSGKTQGILFFEAGEVSHAECGERFGDEAVLQIIKNCEGASEGDYRFAYSATAATRTVLRSVTELMLIALRQFDESRSKEVQKGSP